ncbi:recombinase zinc beta ribbon domain-containing protein [Ruminococcus sp.]
MSAFAGILFCVLSCNTLSIVSEMKHISDLLKQNGLAQKDLAQQVGVTEVSMSRYVNVDRTPRGPILANIARVLHTTTINKILRNEKYIGDALLQKTYTTDFLSKTRVKNNGLVPQYYVEGNHEAIIPKEIYLQVQEELVRRRVVKTSANGKKRSYSCNHCFSQIVICGECGEMFRRLHWNNRGVKSIVWRCISRLESTGLECHARTINELVLQDAVVKAINQMLGDKSSYQAQLQLNIASVIRASQVTSVENIDENLMALQQELIQKAQSKEAYDEIADEIFRLRELRQQTTVDTAARDEQIKRINDLQDYIAQQTTHLTEFDESLVRRWIKQITIWDDRITVELKSGVSIDVNA